MFGWEFPPFNSGGLGVACHGLTRALSDEDVEITFVLPRKFDIAADYLDVVFADTKKITIKQVDSILTPYTTSESYNFLRKVAARDGLYADNLFDEVERYTLRAAKIAEEEQYELVHAHDWLTFGAGIEAAKRRDKPLIAHVHSTEFDRTGGHGVNQHVYDIERRGLMEAKAVIAVSGLTKNILVKEYGINESKINVVHNGIDLSTYSYDVDSVNEFLHLKQQGMKIVLFVGRITLQKGPEYFVKVAEKVIPHNPNVLFVMAGSGDMENQIIRQVAEAKISDKVLFTGFLRDQELSKMYKASDLFVMSSVSEPFGITALESIAHGTPILTSKQTGVSEVVTHALKSDFWDVDEMANQILSYLAYDPLSKSLKQNSIQEVNNMSWKKVAEKCRDIYRKFLPN